MDLWIQGTPWATEPVVWGFTEPVFGVTAPTETVPLWWPVGTAWGWVSVRVEIHLGLQRRFDAKDVIGIRWLGVGVCGAFQSHGIALFREFYSRFNDGDKAEQGHSAPSGGIPWSAERPRSVLCLQSELLHVLENGLGRGKSISRALACGTNSMWPTGSTQGHSCAVSQASPLLHTSLSPS